MQEAAPFSSATSPWAVSASAPATQQAGASSSSDVRQVPSTSSVPCQLIPSSSRPAFQQAPNNSSVPLEPASFLPFTQMQPQQQRQQQQQQWQHKLSVLAQHDRLAQQDVATCEHAEAQSRQPSPRQTGLQSQQAPQQMHMTAYSRLPPSSAWGALSDPQLHQIPSPAQSMDSSGAVQPIAAESALHVTPAAGQGYDSMRHLGAATGVVAESARQESPADPVNRSMGHMHKAETADNADSAGHVTLPSRPSSLQPSPHASPFQSPRSSMLSPGLQSSTSTPSGLQSPVESQHVDWLRTDFRKQQSAFLDDLAFIREVQSQQTLAAGMNPSLELQALHKRFRNWKSQFKVTALECEHNKLESVATPILCVPESSQLLCLAQHHNSDCSICGSVWPSSTSNRQPGHAHM